MAKLKPKNKSKKSLKAISKQLRNDKPSIESHEFRERAAIDVVKAADEKDYYLGLVIPSSGIDVVKAEDEKDYYLGLVIPSCTHGKCLLFKQTDPQNPSKVHRWFGCALHRSSKLCSFKCAWPSKTKIEPTIKEVNIKTSSRDYLPEK
uniref:Uncharacterized protein n=1 Tax=Panagrolaimus sp. PS1159 TaxID=55785 RepID=A0AC35GH41_9BILA